MIDREAVFGRVVVCKNGPRLIAHPGVATESVGLLNDYICRGPGRLESLSFQLSMKADVVTEFGMDHAVSCQGVAHVGDNRQQFPFGLNEIERVLGLPAAFSNHSCHRLALPAHPIHSNCMLGCRLDTL